MMKIIPVPGKKKLRNKKSCLETPLRIWIALAMKYFSIKGPLSVFINFPMNNNASKVEVALKNPL